MIKIRSNNNLEPEDAREAFFRKERDKRQRKEREKWIFRLCILAGLAFAAFIFYALFVDR